MQILGKALGREKTMYREEIVTKFGGYNMATPKRVEQSANIIKADARRRFVVVSAPGKANGFRKITDVLIDCFDLAKEGLPYMALLNEVIARFAAIAEYFHLDPPVNDFQRLQIKLRHLFKKKRQVRKDWVVSRGEYLMAKIMAAVLGAEMVNPECYIKINADGHVLPETYALLAGQFADPHQIYAIPGFYGSDTSNQVKTFPRGGSDITAAVVARAVQAAVCENIKEVPGVAVAHPDIIGNDVLYLDHISYGFMAELAARGAEVLNWAAVYPVEEAGIPIHFLSIDDPSGKGTWVTNDSNNDLVGLAGHAECTVFRIHKPGIGGAVGFGARALAVFSQCKITIDHLATGENEISVVVVDKAMDKVPADEIELQLSRQLHAEVESFEIATISVVSEKRAGDARFIATILNTIADLGAKIFILSDVGAKSLVIGIDRNLYMETIKKLYQVLT